MCQGQLRQLRLAGRQLLLPGLPPLAAPAGRQWNLWTGFIFGHLARDPHIDNMARDVTDIHGDRADFACGEEVQCHFYRFVFEEKGLFGRAPSQPTAQKVKRTFFEKMNR